MTPAVQVQARALGDPTERLTVLLAPALRTGDSPVEVGRKAVGDTVDLSGRALDPVDAVLHAMARNGFDPVVHRAGDEIEVVLHTCPFEMAALAEPETVCAIHLGMAEGISELTGGDLTVYELVPHDPRSANCRLRLHRRAQTGGGAA